MNRVDMFKCTLRLHIKVVSLRINAYQNTFGFIVSESYHCVSIRINMFKVYNFKLDLSWTMINNLSSIDRFGGSWLAIERREKQSLKELKSIATVRSVGASTRIEGSKITDKEVEVLIKNLDVSKLKERDEQEVLGYFETLDIIAESYKDIRITENEIKNLHNVLMKYSEKDQWHKGEYKQHSNVVEATNPDGSKYVIFHTNAPGIETEDAMKNLIEWYNSDTEVHPILRIALFNYEFLSIHPFQDGNGRLSRLLATLLLLKSDYSWVQYVSFEHEIEKRKAEYYRVLMHCQGNRPGENVSLWASFFLNCLSNIQASLMKKLDRKGENDKMSARDKSIYSYIDTHPGKKSGEIAEALSIPLPTVKRLLSKMVAKNLLSKEGVGVGTTYIVEH